MQHVTLELILHLVPCERVLRLLHVAAGTPFESVEVDEGLVGNHAREGESEIRAAIDRLQESGKKVYAFAESFDTKDYFLLTACDEIISPETAFIHFNGFAGTSLHVKGALDKIGINPNLHKIKDYKSAAELVTRDSSSEEALENSRWLLEQIDRGRWAEFRLDLAALERELGQLLQRASEHFTPGAAQR